jgi:hypothetical protein
MTTIHITPDDNGGHNVKLQSVDPDAEAFKLVIKALKRTIDFEYRSYDRGDKLWNSSADAPPPCGNGAISPRSRFWRSSL